MDIKVSINNTFECVYLINGKLRECGEITYGDSEVVYITALPLDAALLPYTVKLVGAVVKSNLELCDCYQLEGDKYYLRIKPRYNYVYSVQSPLPQKPRSLVQSFFFFLTKKKLEDARECLTKELSESVDNNSLASFFDGFKDIVEHDSDKGIYYLITEDDKGKPFNFVLKNNLIDNIIEL